MSSEKKTKLRTAGEIIDRLKWSTDESIANFHNTIIGYDCRINGPMEKNVQDFQSIKDGGEIPEHRIQYFRLNELAPSDPNSFIWDRKSRRCVLFSSGEGPTRPVSTATIQDAFNAIATMERLRLEKEERAKEKAKRKARLRAKKNLAMKKLSSPSKLTTNHEKVTGTSNNERHVWYQHGKYEQFDSIAMKWVHADVGMKSIKVPHSSANAMQIKFITWNILFDLERDESNNFVANDDKEASELRWGQLLDEIRSENADVIALQEVSPRFVKQLQQTEWVRDDFSISSGYIDYLTPYGNLVLWNHKKLDVCNLEYCMDGTRSRAVIASLKIRGPLDATIFNFANVHLPADQVSNSSNTKLLDRSIARKRELGAIICKLQHLEQLQKQPSIPIVLGDFNTEDDSMLSKRFFTDAWLQSEQRDDINGFTFDWKTNERAMATRMFSHSDKEPRRIDYIFVGMTRDKNYLPYHFLKATKSKLLGNMPQSIPPSDHFGISIEFNVNFLNKDEKHTVLYDSSKVDHNAWSHTTISSHESILALLIDDDSQSSLYDKDSSLPLPHVTLLNGFVDINSREKKSQAIQAVTDAMNDNIFSEDMLKSWTVRVHDGEVFEHTNSSTAVLRISSSPWLISLYNTLRLKFKNCDEQEARFVNGWTPHISLGSFDSSTNARNYVNDFLSSQPQKLTELKVHGVGIFRRDVSDGKLYAMATIPFNKQILSGLSPYNLFIQNSGERWSEIMNAEFTILQREVERACESLNIGFGMLEAKVIPYGSGSLHTMLPSISDFDAVLTLKSISPSSDGKLIVLNTHNYIEALMARLSHLHTSSKIRVRSSKISNVDLYILTIKLAPQYPSMDLMICKLNSQGRALDKQSESALLSIEDSTSILDVVKTLPIPNTSPELICKSYQGALRIIKAWASNRKIYGTSTGFIGGGGWGIFLFWVLQNSNLSTLKACPSEFAEVFFKNAANLWSNTNTISILDFNEQDFEEEISIASCRRVKLILAPCSKGNFGRSLTSSTSYCIWNELMLSSAQLKGKRNLNFIGCPLILDTPVLALKVHALLLNKPTDSKAWGATKMLSLLVAMEKKLDYQNIRPVSSVVKKGQYFWFFVGLQERCFNIIDFIQKQKLAIREEINDADAKFDIEYFQNGEFVRRFL